jgi:hypothetical protein
MAASPTMDDDTIRRLFTDAINLRTSTTTTTTTTTRNLDTESMAVEYVKSKISQSPAKDLSRYTHSTCMRILESAARRLKTARRKCSLIADEFFVERDAELISWMKQIKKEAPPEIKDKITLALLNKIDTSSMNSKITPYVRCTYNINLQLACVYKQILDEFIYYPWEIPGMDQRDIQRRLESVNVLAEAQRVRETSTERAKRSYKKHGINDTPRSAKEGYEETAFDEPIDKFEILVREATRPRKKRSAPKSKQPKPKRHKK